MEIIEKIIAERVRPYLQEHKGDIELIDVSPDGYVEVRLLGPCATCPSADQTMGRVVEAAIKAECPHIKEVYYSNVSDELYSQAMQILSKGKM